MSREVRNRVAYGVMIPVLAGLFIAAMLWSISRILLAVSEETAPWVALGFAMNILVGSALAVILRGRRAFAVVTAVIVLTAVVGGIAGAVAGERPIHSLVAEDEAPEGEGGPVEEEPPAEEEPTPPEEESPPPAEGAVHVVAEGTAFDTGTLSLPAGQPVAIEFENRDPLPHNVAIFTEQGGQALFNGDLITDDTTTYEVPPLDPGSYYFQCDVHPQMNGTVEVG